MWKKISVWGGLGDGLLVKDTVLVKDQCWVSCTHIRWLPSTYNSSCRGPNVLSQPLPVCTQNKYFWKERVCMQSGYGTCECPMKVCVCVSVCTHVCISKIRLRSLNKSHIPPSHSDCKHCKISPYFKVDEDGKYLLTNQLWNEHSWKRQLEVDLSLGSQE